MAKRVQFIRHSTSVADTFTGKEGEITVDLDKDELRLHDGTTKGGIPSARRDMANVLAATAAQDGKMTSAHAAALTLVISDLDAEELRAAAAEVGLQSNIDSEAATRLLADQVEASVRTGADDLEIARATAAEALLIPLAQRNAANGVATLDSSSKVVETALKADKLTNLTSTSIELNDLDRSNKTSTNWTPNLISAAGGSFVGTTDGYHHRIGNMAFVFFTVTFGAHTLTNGGAIYFDNWPYTFAATQIWGVTAQNMGGSVAVGDIISGNGIVSATEFHFLGGDVTGTSAGLQAPNFLNGTKVEGMIIHALA